MNRIFYCALLVVTAISITSCATTVMELKPTAPEGKHVYKISTLGFSRDIRDDAIKNAGEFCNKQNKHYKFIRNIFLPQSVAGVDMVSYDLFFFCLDEQLAEPIPPAPEAVEENKLIKPESAPEENDSKAEPAAPPARVKHIESTGDSPGEKESLGDETGSSGEEMVPAKHDGAIIEEILGR
jgi:hypothetical protein